MRPDQCHSCMERSDRLSHYRFCPACARQPRYFFHGGHPGLETGMLLLPPGVTGNRANLHRKRLGGPATGRWYSEDRLYSCASAVTACYYAAAHGGDLYIVAPEGEVVRDPTMPPAMHIVSSNWARIVGVIQRRVPLAWRELEFDDAGFFARVQIEPPAGRFPAGICGHVEPRVPPGWQEERQAWLRDRATSAVRGEVRR